MSYRLQSRRRLLAAAAAMAATLPLAIVFAPPAHAALSMRHVATTGADNVGDAPNDCTSAATPCQTIQHAVDEADASDTISIGPGTYSESVLIRKSLTVLGSGATSITGDVSDPGLLIDGTDTDQPPSVVAKDLVSGGIEVLAADATLSDLTSGDTSGDGLDIEPGSNVVASSSSFSNNLGDGVDMASSGTLTMTDVAIDQNGQIGLRVSSGAVSITHSEVSANADGGVVVGAGGPTAITAINRDILDGNAGAGAVALTGGTVNVLRSSITRTLPLPDSSYGGGVFVQGGTANVAESTIDANTAFGVLVEGGTATVTAATISGTKSAADTSTQSGAVAVDPGSGTAADLKVTGTILDANQVVDCTGPHTDLGYNLISDSTCGSAATGTKADTSAHLGPLGFHGGPTETRLPGRASAALNAIPVGKAGCAKGVTDQRGTTRPDSVTRRCDIGAVELTISNPKIHAKLKSALPHAHGVFHGPVKITFRCKLGTAPLRHKCPNPLHVRKPGKHKIAKTIKATDGGRATVDVHFTIKH